MFLQSLQFMVRDWTCPYECEYGIFGGKSLLAKRLQVKLSSCQVYIACDITDM